MTDREKLIAQLTLHEGVRLLAYQDTRGVWTIGIGRNLTGKGISAQEARDLLAHDIDECEQDLASFAWFATLDPVRRRVVTDLRFNLGSGGFRLFTKLIHALAIQDYETAAREILSSQAAKQDTFRYGRLARMMATDFDEVNG